MTIALSSDARVRSRRGNLEAPRGFDPARDFARLGDDPTYVAWDRLMRTFQEPAPEADPGEWWAPMEQVFDLDWPAGPDS